MNTPCKLCGKPGALVKCSHVIPKWMYAYGPMRLLTSHTSEFDQRSPTGVYGQFVCADCEDKFQKWDDYAAKVLRGNSTLTTVEAPSGLISVYDFGSYNYLELKLFFISVLWRTYACEHNFFDQVELGNYAETLATCLLRKDKNLIDSFDVLVTYSHHWISFGVLEPRLVSLGDVSYWQLYMPHYQALIKVDEKPSPEHLNHVMLTEGKPLYMVEKNFDEFGEREHFRNIYLENKRKKVGLSNKNT
jgi:hypothetical protein